MFAPRDMVETRKQLRHLEDPRLPEFRIRVWGTGVAAALGYWFADIPIMLPWYLGVLCSIVLAQVIHRVFWHSTTLTGFYFSLLGGLAQSVAVASLPWWLFQSAHPADHVLGMLVILGGLLHIIIQRSVILPMMVIVAVPFVLALLLSVPKYIGTEPGYAATITLAVVVIVGYSVAAIVQRERDRFRLEIAQRSSAEAHEAATLSRFTGAIAHDFNNLLSVIIGNLQLYRELNSDNERRAVIDEAEAAAHRGAQLVSQLMRYSGTSVLMEEPINVADHVQEVFKSASRLIPQTMSIDMVVTAPDAYAKLDPVHFEAAILNLVSNSVDACDAQGRIEFRIEEVAPRAENHEGHTQRVRVSVTDTGGGIPASILAKVTEPFFTTKAPGKGTGLGLASVKGFVEHSGGCFGIESEVGVGTTVSMTFDQIATAAPIR